MGANIPTKQVTKTFSLETIYSIVQNIEHIAPWLQKFPSLIQNY